MKWLLLQFLRSLYGGCIYNLGVDVTVVPAWYVHTDFVRIVIITILFHTGQSYDTYIYIYIHIYIYHISSFIYWTYCRI